MRRNKGVCIYVWRGAGIPPELQLAQTQKNIAAWQTGLGFSFGTTSLVSAQAFLQNIGHWLTVRKETEILLFLRRTTHPSYLSELCALDRCTTQSLSWTASYLKMIGKWFHPINPHLKKTCLLSIYYIKLYIIDIYEIYNIYIAGIKSPAHTLGLRPTRTPTPSKHDLTCASL